MNLSSKALTLDELRQLAKDFSGVQGIEGLWRALCELIALREHKTVDGCFLVLVEEWEAGMRLSALGQDDDKILDRPITVRDLLHFVSRLPRKDDREPD